MCSTSKASVLRQFCTEINKKQKKRPGLHPLSKLANCEISVCAYRDAHSCNCICPSHFHTESLTYPLSLILLQERSFMFYSKQTSEIKKNAAGEMAQELRASIALAQNTALLPSRHSP